MIDDEKTHPGWKPTIIEEGIPSWLNPAHHDYSRAEIKAIHRHERNQIKQMKPIYKIQETVYFVMRYKQPY